MCHSRLEDADGHLFISRPGEIATGAQHGFYTYEAKYVDAAGADRPLDTGRVHLISTVDVRLGNAGCSTRS